MEQKTTVILPNGMEIADVPKGTTQAVIIDKLLRGNVITTTQAEAWQQGIPVEVIEQKKVEEEKSESPISDTLTQLPDSMANGAPRGASVEGGQSALNAIGNNMDIPGGIAGSIMGAKAGTVAGPWGVVGGTVAGGAIGTFGGKLMTDWMVSPDVDFGEAAKAGLIAGGMDALTLGAASKFKAASKAMGFGPDEIASLWKKYTKQAPSAKPDALPVGSPESLQQTQNILEEGNGSLTAFQTGEASGVTNVMEGIGQIGVVSSGSYARTTVANANILAKRLDELINDSLNNVGLDNVGASVHGILQGGKKAALLNYSSGIDEIMSRIGNNQVNPKWLSGVINKFRKEGKTEWGTIYDPATMKVMDEWEGVMGKLPTLSVKDLLAFQKKLNGQISQLGDFGATQNTTASRELAILAGRLRKTTGMLLEKVSPESYKVYTGLNTAYGEAMEGLVPKLNANIVSRADKGDYESIAKVLEGKNPDKIEAFMKSIDTAYTQAKIAGVDMDEVARYATPAQAKQAIQAGWLKNIFGDASAGAFDPSTYSRLAAYYEKPANARAAKAILGDDWGSFKALVNAMSEASKKDTGFIGSLVLRSKEAGAVSGTAQLLTGGATAVASLPAAGAIFLGPVLLSKIASSPQAVRALLVGNAKANSAKIGGQTAAVSTIMNETIQAIMDMLSKDDQAEVRQSLR